jgi:hypothetical protein
MLVYILKVKQSRYMLWRRLGGEEVYSFHSFTTSALGGDPGIHCTGGWVGPRAGLDTEVRGKILCPCRGSNPDRPVVQPVVRQYTA